MGPPPAKRQKRERVDEKCDTEKSEKAKKPPTQFLDLPPEITQKIMQELFGIQSNRVGDSRAPITQTGQEFSYWGEILPRRESVNSETKHLRINYCKLKGMAITATCSRLRREGLEVLLEQNRYVAVRGYVKAVTEALEEFGIKSYWTQHWENHWSAHTGLWKVANTVCRPELIINFQGCNPSDAGRAPFWSLSRTWKPLC